MTRLGLLTETVLAFLKARYEKRYLDREGYFADARWSGSARSPR